MITNGGSKPWRMSCASSCCRRRQMSSRASHLRAMSGAAQGRRRSRSRMRRCGLDLQRDLLDLFAASAGDFLDGWFESAPIKAAFGFDGIVGNYASPYTPGSAYVLLHHCFGEVNGKKGVWGHAIGGMGAITAGHGESRRRARRRDPPVDRAVREVLVEKGRAVGVVTENGETIRAAAVVVQPQPQASLPPARRPGAPCRPISGGAWKLALRVWHVSHECRAVRTAGFHRSARARAGGAPRRRHHHRPEPRLYGAGLFRRAYFSAGRAARSSKWSFHRHSTTRSRRPASTSRACSASMSRRSCPTARHGTTTVKPSPIS